MGLIVVVVLLNDDVTVPVMRAIHRAADDDRVGAVVTAAAIVKCDVAMATVMAALGDGGD